ncbi:hypothetical protein RoPhREQ3_gp53 [Rhodococcus phage REQ3]|uniref:Uncharacterized protein n=1 Tax=Rhodococcus phage REQ3 TaxID=1109714 RepID=G9FHA0_9CAUD|nr:hypothetical protein RoPhREQ3_gp53 [Rhodococcus phage REQ3]AEV51989.1 hypothetical protein [Rhodococcus phage REQ3]
MNRLTRGSAKTRVIAAHTATACAAKPSGGTPDARITVGMREARPTTAANTVRATARHG